MKTSIKTLAVASALAAALAAPAGAAIVVNGGFEADPGVDGLNFSASFGSLPSGSEGTTWEVFAGLPGWEKTTGAGIEIQTAATPVPVDPNSGSYHVELDSNNNSGMKQKVTLGVGRYLLSFFYSPRVGGSTGPGTNPIEYGLKTLDGLTNILGPLTVTGPNPPEIVVGDWTLITKEFTITTKDDYYLHFAAVGVGESLGGFLDDVSIEAIPVPAALPLLGLALAGLGFAARRRKAA